ncbi:MAG: DsbA family protein [Propionibacteriaceae bacterium]|jgi:protein-disulfide isomerase|nr:DsbA family protein [Propionibacteriaceae bacterium]
MANSTRKRAQLQAERLAAAKKARRRRNALAIIVAALVVALVAFLVWRAFAGSGNGTPSSSAPVTSGSAATGGSSSAGSVTGALTPPNASPDGKGIYANPAAAADPAHTLVIYGDYQCSACYSYEEVLKPLLQEAIASTAALVEMRNRDFLDEDSGHGNWSRPASIASACADTVGVFAAYHFAIYDHYGELSDEMLRATIPGELGLTGDALASFQACYDNQATAAWVDTMESQGAEDMYNAGYTGTPTFVLDGSKLDITTWADTDGNLDMDKARVALGLS